MTTSDQARSDGVDSGGFWRPTRRDRSRLLLDAVVVVSFAGAWITHDQGATMHSLVPIMFTAAALLHARLRQPTWSRRRRLDHLTYVLVVAVAVTGVIDWVSAGEVSIGHGAVAVVTTVIIGAHIWKHRRSLRRLLRNVVAGPSTGAASSNRPDGGGRKKSSASPEKSSAGGV